MKFCLVRRIHDEITLQVSVTIS